MSCVGVVNAEKAPEQNTEPTPQQKVEAVLAADDQMPMVYILPETVEVMLKDVYGGDKPDFNWDYLQAADYYDRVASDQDGVVSMYQLFMVCIIARGRSEVLGKYKSTADVVTNEWPICLEEFIQPLIELSEDASVLDNYLFEQYFGDAFNEPCTPSQKRKSEPDMLCTSNKHANDPAFQKAMDTKFRKEGGCGDANDGKGLTCFGVAGFDHPEVYYEDFSRADAEEIAWSMYTRNRINLLPDAIRGDVLMALWGTGNRERSIGYLQDVLGVARTNVVDEETIEAAKNYDGSASLRKRFYQMRLQDWKTIKNGKRWEKYGKGWANAMLLYLENGCHTVPTNPLIRDKKSTGECAKHLGKAKTQVEKDAVKKNYMDKLRAAGDEATLNKFLENVKKAEEKRKKK